MADPVEQQHARRIVLPIPQILQRSFPHVHLTCIQLFCVSFLLPSSSSSGAHHSKKDHHLCSLIPLDYLPLPHSDPSRKTPFLVP